MIVKAIEAQPETLEDLLFALGDIAPSRIRLNPAPGTATVRDVERNKLCELIDGVLVEKPVGYSESNLAVFLIVTLDAFVRPRRLGKLTGPDGTFGFSEGLVRLPDVAFISIARWKQATAHREPVPYLAPDLAIEVLSPSNTRGEMERKVSEFFAAGVRLVWLVDPKKRQVAVHTSAEDFRILSEDDALDGGDVLPGFSLALRDIFAELENED